jgi:hypothetical protein
MTSEFPSKEPPTSPYQAYLEESKAPIASLLFTLPLFLLYHSGIYAIQKMEDIPWVNGADRIIASVLTRMGVSGSWISLCFVGTVMLIWQHASLKPWRIHARTFVLMFMESILFSIPPFLLGKFVHHLLSTGAGQTLPLHINLVLALGAGVYEEFFFRMLLMGMLLFLLGTIFRLEGTVLYASAIVLQALLFALFHHLPGSIEPIQFANPAFWKAFAFRMIAGIYFAYIYQERGFGVAAGSHSAYDVVAVLLNAFR